MSTGTTGKEMSSIVMKAIDARTFSELELFVKDLESRPIERLLRDIPELVQLSEAKISIIAYVIATKFRHGDDEEKRRIRESVSTTLEQMPLGTERNQVFEILKRLR